MKLSIKSNINDVKKGLSALEKKYLPNAMRHAINDTLFGLRDELRGDMDTVFDRPVAFTKAKGAWGISKASKNSLIGQIEVKPAQRAYLTYQVHGGARTPKGKAIPVPRKGVAMATHGGLKKGWKSLLDKKNHFSGTLKGRCDSTPGIYKRLSVTRNKPSGEKLKLVLSWEKRTIYTPHFDVESLTRTYVKRHFSRTLRKKIDWYMTSRG